MTLPFCPAEPPRDCTHKLHTTAQLQTDLGNQPRTLRYSRRRLSISTHRRDSGKLGVAVVLRKRWGATATCSAIEPAARCIGLPSCALARLSQGRAIAPLDPEWGPAAPTSPRCWSSENHLNKVRLPPPCPLQPSSLTLSPRLPPRAAVSYAFARGTGHYEHASWSLRTPRTASGAA